MICPICKNTIPDGVFICGDHKHWFSSYPSKNINTYIYSANTTISIVYYFATDKTHITYQNNIIYNQSTKIYHGKIDLDKILTLL